VVYVELATWTLRLYGFLAISHLLLQYRYALGHQWRLYKEKARAAKDRGVTGSVYYSRTWRAKWYAAFIPGTRSKRRALEKAQSRTLDTRPMPASIAVWVTVFQETPRLLWGCLTALSQQDYQGKLTVFVVDDGSYLAQIEKYSADQPPPPMWFRRFVNKVFERKPENYRARRQAYEARRNELLRVIAEVSSDDPRIKFVPAKSNGGKREAQRLAWMRSSGHELYFSVDSDTVLDSNAISQLASNFRNPDVAAATGYVDVGNWKQNWLTRLIDMRYWSAFFVERAAQSYHQAVMCCSGPLAAYRASVVDQVMGRYATQRFLDRLCTFGDDRHLTNLVLSLGYLVVMDPRAHCLTAVPTTLRQYIRQQTRWNKSFYREMLWTTGAIKSHSWYMTYDLAMQFLLPFLLIAALVATAVIAVSGGGFVTVSLYLGIVAGVGFVRSLYAVFARRGVKFSTRLSYLLFFCYGFIYVFVLMPVRLRALVGLLLGNTAWGTREA